MKKKRAVNRILSVVLAVIMVFELLPAGLVVHAMSPGHGSGTQEDPVVVKNFAELKEALESEEDLYIRVDEFENSEGKSYYELGPEDGYYYDDNTDRYAGIMIPKGYSKHLELNSVIDIRAKDENLIALSFVFGNLTVYGNGGIVFSGKRDLCCVLYLSFFGNLTVWGNVSIEGKNDMADGTCVAIMSSHAFETIDIRGGRIKGTGWAAVYLTDQTGGKATISGGVFENDTEGSSALSIKKDTDLKLSGGTFQGIEMETGGKAADLSAYLDDCLYLINDEEFEDGTGKTKLEGEVRVLNDNIPAVDVSVAIPYAGNTPVDPVIVTEDVTVSAGTTKWERYDGTNWLVMGGDEAFIAGGKYRVSFIAEPTEGSGRFFSKKYPPTVRVNGDSMGVMPDPVGENDHYFILYAFTASPQYISSMNVNVEVPKEGATPKDAVSTTEHVSVTKTEWAKWDKVKMTWVNLQPADTFEAGKDYRVLVTVAADEGCRISVNPRGRFNEDIEGEVTKANEAECEYYTEFRVPGIIVDSVDISVTEPFDGEVPAEAVATTEHVTVTETLWLKYISESQMVDMTAGETFEEGENYQLYVHVSADTGYEIATDAQIRINSSKPDFCMVDVDECYMDKDFTTGPSRTISEVDVNMALPVVGAKPEKAISATEHVSVTSTVWAYIDDAGKEVTLDPNQDFEAGKTYIVTVFVQADEGYTYSENPVMRINDSIKTTFIQKTAADMSLFRAKFTAEEKTLADLTITKAPDKTEYVAGEHFETTGMEVTARATLPESVP